MDVLLINKNKSVSKVISRGVEKLKLNLTQVKQYDDLDGSSFKFCIIDSELFDESAAKALRNLDICEYLIYLAPKGVEERRYADSVIEKPFVPADIVRELKRLMSKSVAKVVTEDTKEQNIKSILDEEKVIEVKSLLDEDLGDSSNEDDLDIQTDEEFEKLLKEANIDSTQIDNEDENEDELLKAALEEDLKQERALLDKNLEEKLYAEDKIKSEVKKEIEEEIIELKEEIIEKEIIEEKEEITKQSENIKEEIIEENKEIIEETKEVTQEIQTNNTQIEENLPKEQDIMSEDIRLLEQKEVKKPKYEEDFSDLDDLDRIGFESLFEKPKEDEIKPEIEEPKKDKPNSSKLKQELEEDIYNNLLHALQNGPLKVVLKDMKINISITFEEK